MRPFSISSVYQSENNERTIDINPLPKKYCSFDCVFCPLGRTDVKTEKSYDFIDTCKFLKELDAFLNKENIDAVFINPSGESLANNRLMNILWVIKKHHAKAKIISNGYLFNKEEYSNILSKFDVVIGELAVTQEELFVKLQRPIEGYSLENYIINMEQFNKQYVGKFILDITILKKYSDADKDIQKFIKFIQRIKPDDLIVETPSEERLKNAFGIEESRLRQIENRLRSTIDGYKKGE